MAIRHVDGFEDIQTSDLLAVYQQATACTVQSTTTRNGSNALQLAAAGLQFRYTNPAGLQTTGIMGFGFRVSGIAPGLCAAFVDPSATAETHVSLRLLGDGRLEVGRGVTVGGSVLATSTSALVSGTWYWIECKATIDDSAGVIEVRVNGSSTGWIPSTGSLDTRNGGAAGFTQWAFGISGVNAYLDDVYFADGSSTFLGDCKVVNQRASTGNGTYAEWTPSTGTDHGALVDEALQNGDTDYNSSGTVNQRDTYNFAALGISGVVHAVQLTNWAKKTDVGTRAITGMTRIGSTDYLGANEGFLSAASYAPVKEIWPVSPATGIAWTVSEIDGAEFGVKLTT